MCISNTINKTMNNSHINNINFNKSIKSKSPNNFNNKEYTLKIRKINNNMSIDIKRNLSQNKSKKIINNSIQKQSQIKNKSKYVNKNKIKNQNNNNNMSYLGSLINKINKAYKVAKNNSKVRILDNKNNTIDLPSNNDDFIHRNNYKKIVINNKNKIYGDDNSTYRNKKNLNNNLENDFTLVNSYLNNNSYNLIKTTKTKIIKSDLDKNKFIDSNYSNTIENDNEKEKYDHAYNCFKIFKNKQKRNNENYNNINKVIYKSIFNDLKSKSLLKNKEKSNRNRSKNIINISNSTGVRKKY